MLQVCTSSSVQDAEYPESLVDLERILSRRALALKCSKSLSEVITESFEILDALSVWAWSDHSPLQKSQSQIDTWLAHHPLMVFLSTKMRNICIVDGDVCYRKAEILLEDKAQLEDDGIPDGLVEQLFQKAARCLGPDLGGRSVLDLMADNTPYGLAQLKTAIRESDISEMCSPRLQIQIANY